MVSHAYLSPQAHTACGMVWYSTQRVKYQRPGHREDSTEKSGGAIPESPALGAEAFPLGHRGGGLKTSAYSSSLALLLLVGCLTSQQHASVSQGRICTDKFTWCHTWDRSCRSNFPSHPVTVYWHRADQSQCWPINAQAPGRVATGVPVFKSLVWLDPGKNTVASGIRTLDLPLSRGTP